MEKNIISINIANGVSICAMAGVGYLLFTAARKFAASRQQPASQG